MDNIFMGILIGMLLGVGVWLLGMYLRGKPAKRCEVCGRDDMALLNTDVCGFCVAQLVSVRNKEFADKTHEKAKELLE